MNHTAVNIQRPSTINMPIYSEEIQVAKRSVPKSRYMHNYSNNNFKSALEPNVQSLFDFEATQTASTIRELKKNDMLIHEGDDTEYFYEILFGYIKTYTHLCDGRCLVTNFLRKGDFISLPFADKYTVSAQAITRTNVRRYSLSQMNNLLETSPIFTNKILNIAQKEISQATNQMILLGRKNTEERIASFLLTCEHTPTIKEGFQSVVYMPMSLTDIADHLGLTQETVCRTFKKLRNRGLLKTKMPRQQREIYVRDLNSLRQMAELAA